MLVDNQEFLAKLEKIFKETTDKGSVWLWFKQYSDQPIKHRKGKDLKQRQEIQAQQNLELQPFTLLVRLKTKKHRLSTKVASEEAAYFQRLVHNILLVNFHR
jgi:Signal recognition particle 14kD protein